MTNYEEKAEQLSKQHNVTIHPIVFINPDNPEEEIVGYMKEPNRIAKLRALDMALTQPATAGAQILDAFILKEESDMRIMSEKPEHDKYYLGACVAAMNKVQTSVDQSGKKK